MNPEIIIFDEPTASLDPINSMMFEEVLNKLEQEEKTLIISTQDMDFVYRWADRVIVFCYGKIIADGRTTEIFKNTEILKKANLKKPTMVELQELLLDKGLLKDKSLYPKSVKELRDML